MSLKINENACIDLIKGAYQDAVKKNGLIEFTQQVRTNKNNCSGKYSISSKQLDNLFSKNVWKELKTTSGHRKLENMITHVIVEYANHGNRGGVDPGAVMTILNTVQTHLNILRDQIFNFKNNSWKQPPDYKDALNRYKQLITNAI